MKKYRYNGNIPWTASIRYQQDGKWTVMDVNMNKGDEMELPDVASVRWMVTSNKLELVNKDTKPDK